jgi:hypothetical protein
MAYSGKMDTGRKGEFWIENRFIQRAESGFILRKEKIANFEN